MGVLKQVPNYNEATVWIVWNWAANFLDEIHNQSDNCLFQKLAKLGQFVPKNKILCSCCN
jgi:TorA maturation chaperone TorD